MSYHSQPCIDKDIAYKIRQKRMMLGLTQMELAEKAQINWKTINRIENQRGNTSLDIFFEIARALDMTPNELAPASYNFSSKICGIPNLDSRFHSLTALNQLTFISSVDALLDGFLSHQTPPKS